MNCIASQFSKKMIAVSALTLFFLAFLCAAPAADKTVLVSFVSSHEQERAVNALIQSVRERGGACRSSRIYVLNSDPAEFSCRSLRQDNVQVLPLQMPQSLRDYPLALKAFAAAQVERIVADRVDTLVWLDPGVIVLKPLSDLELSDDYDVAVRPVTLANTIGIPPHSAPNEYWQPIYRRLRIDYRTLPSLETVADSVPIQPYYNCEVFAFNPGIGLARRWAELLRELIQDENYQKNICNTFLRRLFLHQAVLSGLISSRIRPDRIKPLPLDSAYPFSQHERLPAGKKAAAMCDLSVAIFDSTWSQDPAWMNRMVIDSELKDWLGKVYRSYLELTPGIYRVEGCCNSYLVISSQGSVLIDPAGAATAAEHFRKIIESNPLQAILLTHAHQDHANDIAQWRAGRDIPVIAQREFKRYYEYCDELQGLLSRRNAIWSGKLPGELRIEESPEQEKANIYFDDRYELAVGDIHFQLFHTPGETPDHVTIWVPELKAVFVGDNYYEYFINNSTFRGTMIRPVSGYIKAIETALNLNPDFFLMGHGKPLLSKVEIRDNAATFLSGLKFIYAETLKGINAGKDLYALMQEIKVPDQYGIRPYYGKVEWTVRGIWQEYVGWFDENPVSMYSIPFSDVYADLLELIGPEKFMARIRQHLEQKEFLKVLHLTDLPLKEDPGHKEANELRCAALRELKKNAVNFIEKIWLNHALRLCEENLKRP